MNLFLLLAQPQRNQRSNNLWAIDRCTGLRNFQDFSLHTRGAEVLKITRCIPTSLIVKIINLSLLIRERPQNLLGRYNVRYLKHIFLVCTVFCLFENNPKKGYRRYEISNVKVEARSCWKVTTFSHCFPSQEARNLHRRLRIIYKCFHMLPGNISLTRIDRIASCLPICLR